MFILFVAGALQLNVLTWALENLYFNKILHFIAALICRLQL